jgi:hypothetical protein
MADIVTKTEVVTLAFGRAVSETRIEDGLIAAISEKYLIPVLGEDFYDDVIANAINYTALLVYLKPIVSYFVKFHLLPEIFVEISNTGLNKVPGNNRVAGSTDDLGASRQNTLDIANMYMARLRKYLDDNSTTYLLYYPGSDVNNKIDIAAGVIIRKHYRDADEFYEEEND